MQDINPNELRLVAMNLLARREHLRGELAQKLKQKLARSGESAPDPERAAEEIEAVLDQLAAENLQSDQRYAESYVRSRSSKGYGPDRIRQELREKGVDGDLQRSALESLELDWVSLAREVRLKKFGSELPRDFKERARQLRFLNYRGFGSEFASAALEGADYDDGC